MIERTIFVKAEFGLSIQEIFTEISAMRQFYLILALAIVMTSCNSSTDPTTDGSYLIATPDTVILQRTDSVKTLDMKLSCGCGFTLQVTGMTGDTSVIKYNPVQNLGDTLSKHSITFSYSPSLASAKTGQISLNFLARKHSYTYTSTISVKMY